MSAEHALALEVLNGPLDGAIITLTTESEWSRVGEGPLVFPWDKELGSPQARFAPGEEGWQLQGIRSAHGTYRINSNERIVEGQLQLAQGDVLKASQTWLQVRLVNLEQPEGPERKPQ